MVVSFPWSYILHLIDEHGTNFEGITGVDTLLTMKAPGPGRIATRAGCSTTLAVLLVVVLLSRDCGTKCNY